MSALLPPGRRVMARATRTFDDRTENGWYYIDPDDAREKALLAGGYMALQEALIEVSVTIDPDPELLAKAVRGRRRGKVETQPGGDDAGGAA